MHYSMPFYIGDLPEQDSGICGERGSGGGTCNTSTVGG